MRKVKEEEPEEDEENRGKVEIVCLGTNHQEGEGRKGKFDLER